MRLTPTVQPCLKLRDLGSIISDLLHKRGACLRPPCTRANSDFVHELNYAWNSEIKVLMAVCWPRRCPNISVMASSFQRWRALVIKPIVDQPLQLSVERRQHERATCEGVVDALHDALCRYPWWGKVVGIAQQEVLQVGKYCTNRLALGCHGLTIAKGSMVPLSMLPFFARLGSGLSSGNNSDFEPIH